ncbi:MAG: adenine-specific methyltransferase EcoRI family protein [Akkermansia sp.]|nr:adenine-specific methyltransferase EcoRI family protein [Akkermansia sp.]
MTAAKKAKKDEFYTQLTDIEKELRYYTNHFKNKVVFCNCDDPEESNFWVFFRDNFALLGLKKLISTHYEKGKRSYKMELTGARYEDGELKFDNFVKTPLKGDGDFRSEECIEILKEADIVVTNPPFSLFREFVAQLMEYKKKFLIIGNINAASYKEVFPLIRDNEIWMGASIHSGDREFRVPDDYPLNAAGYRVDENGVKFIRVKGVRWFTNMDYPQRHEGLILYKTYNPDDYPTYDNYDAINVNFTKEIPRDYDGSIGVPITFLDKYNPEQFEILDANDFRKSDKVKVKAHGLIKDKEGAINGSPKYVRILIKRK